MGNRTLIAVLVCSITAAVVAGCASPTVHQMQSGDRTVGADGEISVTSDGNGNDIVDVQVSHLPNPSRLDEQMSTYSVWLRPDGSNNRYNVGQLRLDDNQSGSVQFTTPFSSYSLKVTGEVDQRQETPSDQIVLRYDVDS